MVARMTSESPWLGITLTKNLPSPIDVSSTWQRPAYAACADAIDSCE